MHRFLHSQTGFSLVQGMIFAAVLAGSSLIATRMLTDQKLSLKGVESRDQIEQLHSLIFTTLQNPDNCTATITGKGGLRPNQTAPVSFDLSSHFINPPSTMHTFPMDRLVAVKELDNNTTVGFDQYQILYGIDYQSTSGRAYPTYMNGNVRIVSMIWNYPDPVSRGVAYLDVTYERLNADSKIRTKQGYGAKTIKKRMGFRIQRDATAPYPTLPTNNGLAFKSCYAFIDVGDEIATDTGTKNLLKELCEEMPIFQWDEQISSCRPKNFQCTNVNEVFTGIDSNGMAKCRNLRDWVDINDYLAPTKDTDCRPGKNARFEVIGNKVRIECF
jgi:hypothetical protein